MTDSGATVVVLSSSSGLALLAGVPAFALLPPPLRAALAAQLVEEHYPAGAIVVAEGEVGDRLFLIATGQVEVTAAGPSGPVLLAAISRGELFGELAVLTPERRRQATVTALTPLTLLSLTAGDLECALAAHPEAREALTGAAESLRIYNFLKQASPFASLDARRLHALADRLERRDVGAGEPIITQGEPGDVCYLLQSGQAEAVRQEHGIERTLNGLYPGTLFGEAALLTDAPRNATVRAVTPCTLLALRREDLLAAMASDADVAGRLRELLRLRHRPRHQVGVEAHQRVTPTGEIVTTLKDPARGAYFRLSPEGWFLWQRMDGQHTLRDLALAYRDAFGGFAPQAVTDLVARLAVAGFLAGIPLQSDVQQVRERSTGPERALRTAKRLLEWQVSIRQADHLFAWLYNRLRFLYTPLGLAVLALIALMGFSGFLLGWIRFHDALHGPDGSAWILLFFLPASFLAILLHEVGHALTVKHFGYEVPRAGIGWYWFGPMAFIDTSDMWLAPRGPRIAVNLAGVATNAVLAGMAALAAWVVPNLLLAAALWQFALSSYLMILVNLNPLLEFDGYYVLMDALERPNLRPKALGWLGRDLVPTLQQRGLAGLRRHGLDVAYGAASILYIGVEAALTVVLYRLFAEDWLALVVPDRLAGDLAWVLAALTVLLAAAGVVADLRLSREGRLV